MKTLAAIMLFLLIANPIVPQGKASIDITFKNFEEFRDIDYYRVYCHFLAPISPFSYGHKSDLFSNKGEFSFSTQVDYPTLANIGWHGQSIVLPVFPGDTIKLEIDCSGKNDNLSTLIKTHSKSNFALDYYIYELDKQDGGPPPKINSAQKIEDYLANAKTDEQTYFGTLSLAHFVKNKVSIKDEKLRFLAFFEVMNRYPVAVNYVDPLKKLWVDEKDDFLKMSSLTNSDIRINDEVFVSFIALINKIRKYNLGSVVFIDLWGTWCGACLYDIKHKKALGMDEIFEKHQVKTVYLCTLSPKKEFDYYVNKLDMTGDHYFFSKEQKQEAKGKFNVYAYPHYMFLNKKGELINDGVPRPVCTTKGVARLNEQFINLVKRLSQ